MVKTICLLYLWTFALARAAPAAEIIRVSAAAELEHVLSKPLHNVEIHLSPGEYHLTPETVVDSTCGNCEEPNTRVDVTAGVRISGSNVWIFGPADRSAVVHTHAGYGLFFVNCSDCGVERLSITGGERDPDGNATNAAVVVKEGSVKISNNRIFENIGDSTLVAKNIVGIMGICGRENSVLTIEGNDILRNSWDGIALYRDASAVITGNVIDGVDKARGETIGGGRGVGIGITWNATADIRDNIIKRYWKGIGIFVDAWGSVRDNIVEDIITWGIAYWDADKGKPVGIFEGNVIYDTGACGASITCAKTVYSKLECRFCRNVIVKTGQNAKYDDPDYYCFQTALALHAVPEGFVVESNIFFGNRRASDDLPDYDVTEEEFYRSIASVCERLEKNPLFVTSDFAKTFCAADSVRQ